MWLDLLLLAHPDSVNHLYSKTSCYIEPGQVPIVMVLTTGGAGRGEATEEYFSHLRTSCHRYTTDRTILYHTIQDRAQRNTMVFNRNLPFIAVWAHRNRVFGCQRKSVSWKLFHFPFTQKLEFMKFMGARGGGPRGQVLGAPSRFVRKTTQLINWSVLLKVLLKVTKLYVDTGRYRSFKHMTTLDLEWEESNWGGKKSCIRETKYLSTNVDSSTDTKKILLITSLSLLYSLLILVV